MTRQRHLFRRYGGFLVVVGSMSSDIGCSSNANGQGVTSSGGAGGVAGLPTNSNGGVAMGAGGAATSTGGVSNIGLGGSLPAAGTTGAGGSSAGGAPSAGGSSSGGSSGNGGTAGTNGAGGTSAGGGNNGGGGMSSGGSSATCPTGLSLSAGETTGSIDVGGTKRTYILHVPSSYTGRAPVPLVIDFHPIFGSGSSEKGVSGYAALSDKEGFIVAWPDGIDQAWNVGPCCTQSRTVDDVGFAKALVDKVKGAGCVDAKRVYGTGFSMGGGMSHYIACHAADVFATVVPASFDLLMENEGDCHPARPITVLSFRGTADNVVPYAGGASNPPNGLPTIHFLGAVGTFQKWAMLDGCTGSPTMGSDGCQTYSQCNAGVEVTLCTITGGGHAPGDAQKGWAMMKKHPMP